MNRNGTHASPRGGHAAPRGGARDRARDRPARARGRFGAACGRVPVARRRAHAAPSRAHAARPRAPAARPRDGAGRPSDRTSCRRLLEELRGVIRRDAAVRELPKDLLATFGLAIRLSLRWKAERADHRIEARPHGRVADPELALDILEVATRFDERLQELELIRCELVEPAESERTLETRAAGGALEARDAQRLGADGA